MADKAVNCLNWTVTTHNCPGLTDTTTTHCFLPSVWEKHTAWEARSKTKPLSHNKCIRYLCQPNSLQPDEHPARNYDNFKQYPCLPPVRWLPAVKQLVLGVDHQPILAPMLRRNRNTRCRTSILISELPNTAHSCSRHGPASAWLTSERPSDVIPIPQTFTQLPAHTNTTSCWVALSNG